MQSRASNVAAQPAPPLPSPLPSPSSPPPRLASRLESHTGITRRRRRRWNRDWNHTLESSAAAAMAGIELRYAATAAGPLPSPPPAGAALESIGITNPPPPGPCARHHARLTGHRSWNRDWNRLGSYTLPTVFYKKNLHTYGYLAMPSWHGIPYLTLPYINNEP